MIFFDLPGPRTHLGDAQALSVEPLTKKIRLDGGMQINHVSAVGNEAIGGGIAPITKVSTARRQLQVKSPSIYFEYSPSVYVGQCVKNAVVVQRGSGHDVLQASVLFSPRVSDIDTGTITQEVKGNLKRHIDFWEQIEANSTVHDIINNGYKIPLLHIPPSRFFKNNRSALQHSQFVTSEIRELLLSGRIKEVSHPPYLVNPLTVSVRGSQKRLILDLSSLNVNVYKDKIKFDDWKAMIHFLAKGIFMFKFDISKGYHHIDIFSTASKISRFLLGN